MSEHFVIVPPKISEARPPCSRCGGPMWVARIEPGDKPGHDLRTYECPRCESIEVVSVKVA